MNVLRVNLLLAGREKEALDQLARVDFRHPREELRFLVLQEARKRGLLSDAEPDTDGQSTIQERGEHDD